MPMPGAVTPATIGFIIVSSSCRPRKYQGAFDGLGVRFVLASACSGAFTKIEKNNTNSEVHVRQATNSITRRCGHVCTLSTGVALTSWIEPDLPRVSRRWGWPPGPAAIGRRGGDGGPAAPPAAAGVMVVVAAAGIGPAAGLLLAALAGPLEQVGRNLGRGLAHRGSLGRGGAGRGASAAAAAFLRASSARLRRCSGISVMKGSFLT